MAGPARLSTLLRYAAACGVGPSVRMLQARPGTEREREGERERERERESA